MKLATLCYLRQNNQTLMLHRNKKPNDIHQGKWNGLGGKFEPGETPEGCARREIEEECGLVARHLHLKGLLTFPLFKDDEDWYVFLFLVTAFSGTLHSCAEGELRWIDNERLLDLNLWEGDKLFIPFLDKPGHLSGLFRYQQGSLVEHHIIHYP